MKKNRIVLIIILAISFSGINIINAQTESKKEESPVSVSCDMMSRYVWRGSDFGASPSIQPGIEFSNSGFTIGTWGAYALNLNGVQEADLYIGYTFKDVFSLTVTDYFFPEETASYQYFDYNSSTTGHILETTLSFKGTDKIPLSVLIASNVWGADARKMNTDGTVGNIQYSTYAELGYSYKNLNAFIGFNLTNPDEYHGESGFYGDAVGVVNLGLTAIKNIEITDKFSLPLSVSLITNPQAGKIYLLAGFSF